MRVTGLFLIKPAARAAEGCVTITIAVVVENIDACNVILREKAIGLGGSAPPVIVISLQNELPAGEAVDEQEILPRFLQIHPPAQIAA